MIIKRSIKLENGDELTVNVTLTRNELWEAYREAVLIDDINDVEWAIENCIADASDDAEEAIFREMLDDEDLVKELAVKARERIDDADEWRSGTAYTFLDIVQDACEDLKIERNVELGWLK